MTSSKISGYSILVLTALSLTTLPVTGAGAAVLKVKPMQLKKSDNLQLDIRLPFRVGSVAGSAAFHYKLKLKKGSRITGLRYQHSGITSGLSPSTAVFLMRARATAADPSRALQPIITGLSHADTGHINEMIWVDGGFAPDAVKRVQKGWTYFLVVGTTNAPSFVGDIEVTHR